MLPVPSLFRRLIWKVNTGTASVLSFLVFWLVLGEAMKQHEMFGHQTLGPGRRMLELPGESLCLNEMTGSAQDLFAMEGKHTLFMLGVECKDCPQSKPARYDRWHVGAGVFFWPPGDEQRFD